MRLLHALLAGALCTALAFQPTDARALSPAAEPAARPPGPAATLVATPTALPLHFEPNHGQTDGSVRFLARGPGYTLFLTGSEAVIVTAPLRSAERPARDRRYRGVDRTREAQPSPHRLSTAEAVRDAPAPGRAVVRIKLVGANADPLVTGVDQLPGRVNYFLGNDPARWRTNIPTYARVTYRDVYPGVDLVYDGSQRRMEFDFVVAPGADPGRIRLTFEGAGSVALDARGDLLLSTVAGELRFGKPQVYQEMAGRRVAVDAGFALSGEARNGAASTAGRALVSVRVAAYDRSKPLVIDPVLSYSTYLGGSSIDDQGFGIAVDSSGNAYVTGFTQSADFPTANAFQAAPASETDAFVTKLNAAGSALVYSTYLGGIGDDQGNAIAVDTSGNAYVTGRTSSTDFPTMNAFQVAHGGGFYDAFVTKLNAAGSALVYSTYLGGSSVEESFGIAVDSSGNAHVAGRTDSTNFPTMNAFQAAAGGFGDAFVTKLEAGSALVYSTYLGGSFFDRAFAIAVDTSGNAYVTGQTSSADFPTANPLQAASGGGTDVFVAKLNAAGSTLVYSTYLGGSSTDEGFGIAVDADGNAHVTGETFSANFPTASPFQAALAGSFDAFVTKINAAGTVLVYSTYLGGSNTDEGFGIAVDTSGNAYVTGETFSADFPTASPFQAALAGSFDAFVTKINAAGTAPVYSTYLGGSGDDFGNGIAVDTSGNAYVAGQTTSADFPTANAFQAAFGGGDSDAFVVKISDVSPAPTAPSGLTATLASPSQVTLAWTDQSADETGFELERDTDGTGLFALLATVPAATGTGTRTFADTTVVLNRTYTYRVRAVNGAGASDYSNTAAVTVQAGKLVVLPPRVTFSGVAVGNSATKTVTLQNAGQGTLTGSVSGTLAAPFTLVGGGGTFSLAPGATHIVTIQFGPTTRGTARSGLTVTSDDPARPSTRVQVTGIVR